MFWAVASPAQAITCECGCQGGSQTIIDDPASDACAYTGYSMCQTACGSFGLSYSLQICQGCTFSQCQPDLFGGSWQCIVAISDCRTTGCGGQGVCTQDPTTSAWSCTSGTGTDCRTTGCGGSGVCTQAADLTWSCTAETGTTSCYDSCLSNPDSTPAECSAACGTGGTGPGTGPATGPGTGAAPGVGPPIGSATLPNFIGYTSISALIAAIANFLITYIAMPLAILMIIYSGLLFVTAGGNEEKIKKAKRNLSWTLLGVLIILSANVLITYIQSLLSGQGGGQVQTFLSSLKAPLNQLILTVFALATVYFIWGIVMFMRASGSGDEQGITTGKRHMVWGIVGMAIMGAAAGIVNLIKSIIP